MTLKSTAKPKQKTISKSLGHALNQSERIKGTVEECAEDLAAVNSVLKKELSNIPSPPAVEEALQKSETVENKVQDCAVDLATVAHALKEEINERQTLEHLLETAQKQEEAARHAAFHDPLTSLPNRVLFNDHLEHGLAQAERHGWILAVMFIDLDGFKAINDTHGHIVGDQVLQVVAGRLKAMTRADDTVSRHGGDEFVYLLLEIQDKAAAGVIAQKIGQTLSEVCNISANNAVIRLSIDASIGIAIYPADGNTTDALLKSADKAMYSAKRMKMRYCYADESKEQVPRK